MVINDVISQIDKNYADSTLVSVLSPGYESETV